MVFDPGHGGDRASDACAANEHEECGHVRVGIRRPSAGQIQSMIMLCRCDCHASCSVAAQTAVYLTVWQHLCGCPGGSRYRAWKEDPEEPWPGAQEAWEKTRRSHVLSMSARREARRAAQASAPGRTREQVREIYAAELQARDQELPPEPFLEVDLDMLTGHHVRAIWKMQRLRWAGRS